MVSKVSSKLPWHGVTAAGMAVVVVMMPTGTGVLSWGRASVGSVSLGEASEFPGSGSRAPWLCQNLSGWVQLLHQLHSLRNSLGKQLGRLSRMVPALLTWSSKNAPKFSGSWRTALRPLPNFLCNAGRGCETPVPAGRSTSESLPTPEGSISTTSGAIGFQRRGQRRRKIPCEGSNRYTGVQRQDLITALPQKRGITLKSPKSFSIRATFLLLNASVNSFLDQGGLARSQKAGNQIHISHHVLL